MSEKISNTDKLERILFRLFGVVVSVSVLRLLSHPLPIPQSSFEAAERMVTGVALPAWLLWGHYRNLFKIL